MIQNCSGMRSGWAKHQPLIIAVLQLFPQLWRRMGLEFPAALNGVFLTNAVEEAINTLTPTRTLNLTLALSAGSNSHLWDRKWKA